MNKRLLVGILGGWLLALVIQPRDLIAKVRG
jgi:hypothetical protein